MSVANALFYLLAALTVVAAAGVVLLRNPIANVLSLLFAFFCLATIYLLAGFQFLAATQILVYAGAIMVLFLFVIMLLNLAPGPKAPKLEEVGLPMFLRRKSGVTVVIAAALLLLGASAILGTQSTGVEAAGAMPREGIDAIRPTPGTNDGLAAEMFGRYLLPFEAVSMLLLATAVAVVVLAKRNRPGDRSA
ncbi:MAG: NADH-quinone oxidoreductase subunit J [Planctomycetes bacterium]|nr:NADH-quinone oxidoreductase subunit J [Planctomycetota bacterium]